MRRFFEVSTFNIQRHLISRRTMRQFRGDAIDAWHLATCAA
ncbi:hypothetical protein VSX64_22070 [Aurantimonas sp. C2-6-R+9]|nr:MULTISPECIES: hypothetical protein [unclassified Aurantimonas]MEC5293308.1 hypothetical protein [Aurantimonas sp. C2-3-R2]MEC5383471.1 hypothetical protein [Aurantimonas sp. C2-6-R+9]MEC5414411.1 hypothetical protein [Aurantimonas sp. C2-4-R8]